MSGLSLYDYRATIEIQRQGHPFYSLIAAAMWQADSTNIELLRGAFPEVWRDFDARYHAPGGMLPGESVSPSSGAV